MSISKKVENYTYKLSPDDMEEPIIPAQTLVYVVDNNQRALQKWKNSKVSKDIKRVSFLLCEKKFPDNYTELIEKHPNLVAIPKAQSKFIISNYINEKIKSLEVKKIKRHYENELENVHAMKESFMSNITHELRTPLNTIIGYSEIIHEDVKSKDFDSIEEYISNVMEAGTHLQMTIENILHFISLENVDAKLCSEDIDKDNLKEMIEPVFDQIFKKSNNQSIYDIATNFEFISTDRERLKVLLSILVDNANKFTNNGEVSLSIYPSNDQTCFQIQDNGIGFDKGILGELTKPFTQSEFSKSRKFGGLGLGLSLCKKLIKFLHGELYIDSKENKGTTIRVILPNSY